MRIAQVAPLHESVPPRYYGGTERVVSYLTEELVRAGHDVSLFASGDSLTVADLVPCCSRSLRLDGCGDPLARHLVMLEHVVRRSREFDIVHFHLDYLSFPSTRRLMTAHLTTMHGRLDAPELQVVFEEFADAPVVSISHSQRHPLPQAHWIGTVHHGLPVDLLGFNDKPDDYFAFLGRISPEKRVDRAIAIAVRVGMPIKIAAKIDRADQEYYSSEIEHLLAHPLVEFVGEIGEHEKCEFLGKARALLFPIDWPEPFGLVVVEALACGTPVVTFRNGSVPELIDHGVTGFLVDDLDQAVCAAREVGRLDRRACRRTFESRFSATRMAENYLELYASLGADLRQASSSDGRGAAPSLA